jgi:hypothetical protein
MFLNVSLECQITYKVPSGHTHTLLGPADSQLINLHICNRVVSSSKRVDYFLPYGSVRQCASRAQSLQVSTGFCRAAAA